MTVAALRALHAVIGSAIDEIEEVYKSQSANTGLPLDYPSLDVPYYSTRTNAPEVDKSEELRTEPIVFGAANKIVAACGQITATVHKPFFSLIESVNGGNVIACMQFLEATHVVEILREAGSDGASVKDIANKATEIRRSKDPKAAEIDSSKLSHVLRLLATYHWVRELRPDVFANNRLSSFIDSGKSTEQLKASVETKYDETDGVAAFVAMSTDEVAKIQTGLSPWLLGGGPATGYASPFNLAFDTQLKYYEWLEEPGNESRLRRFGHSMNGTRYWELAENIIHGFTWDKLPQDAVVVDVGGGIGSVSVTLSEAYPHLRFVVEDRAPVVAVAPQSWGHRHAELFSSGRVSFHAQDFLEPRQPFTVPGVGTVNEPHVFLLRAVLHNWPDENVHEILTHLRRAAGPHTRLLVVDNLLPYACIDEDSETSQGDSEGAVRSLVPDGSPLLPNLGRASANGYLLDISMLGMMNAKERTYREMDALLRSAGWQISRVKRAVGSLWAYTAAEPI
ncbi:S-adenosyl-L-methionine-dependent methyltransferase [Polyporus arcularius HHB13444]|uniref:S-adenosyl-L-methionine-dependent methyltransferase n=1 Tax=Polyporus arcularius HHB13444 TaxID=1314778 RepID=A0A5C3NUK2_9APHY|nr:S-adenosyl-L-methionine-dependent methyltransferase [Polyporus arcularius HHB13444]